MASTKLPASFEFLPLPMRAHELLGQYHDASCTVVLTPSSGRGGVTPVHPTLSKHMLMEPYDKGAYLTKRKGPSADLMDSSTKSGLLYMWWGMSECLNAREQWKRRSLPLPTPSSLVQGLEDQGLSRPLGEVPPAAERSAVPPQLLGWRPCRGLMRREV